MTLVDHEIAAAMAMGRIVIEPEPDMVQLQTASVDLRLGKEFREFRLAVPPEMLPIRMSKARADDYMQRVTVSDDGVYELRPGGFVLGTTVEFVKLPADIGAVVDGRSSVGRWGVGVHVTAGYCDPGFSGQITLEITNWCPFPIALEPGEAICQLRFINHNAPAQRPYGHAELKSKYQGQRGAVASRGTGRK